jgi:hypothetical protein
MGFTHVRIGMLLWDGLYTTQNMINKWADCSKGDFNAIFAIFMEYVSITS